MGMFEKYGSFGFRSLFNRSQRRRFKTGITVAAGAGLNDHEEHLHLNRKSQK